MSRTRLCAALWAIIFVTPLMAQAPKASPPSATPKDESKTAAEYFKDAKVGDWVQHKMSAGPQAMLMKQTVTAKTADEMSVRYEQKLGDQQLPAHDQKINLREKFDPNKPPMPPEVKIQVEKLGSGKETITVGGKKYECEWTRNKVTMDGPFGKMTSTSKAWVSKDVPLGGMVKTESETEMPGQPKMTQQMELVAFGRGK